MFWLIYGIVAELMKITHAHFKLNCKELWFDVFMISWKVLIYPKFWFLLKFYTIQIRLYFN